MCIRDSAYWVTYSKGELNYEANTYAEQFLGLDTATGMLTGVQNVALVANGSDPAMGTDNKDCTIAQYTDKAGQTAGVAASFKAEVSSDLLGQVVKVYFKKGASEMCIRDSRGPHRFGSKP